jgi:hypothetical protein
MRRCHPRERPMSGGFFAAMSDMEIVGHVGAIPDASELSQALAGRIRLLVEERDEIAAELAKTKADLLELRISIGEDKLDAYREIVEKAA